MFLKKGEVNGWWRLKKDAVPTILTTLLKGGCKNLSPFSYTYFRYCFDSRASTFSSVALVASLFNTVSETQHSALMQLTSA